MTEPQLPTGSRIGQYEIREFIARGGMAEVYLAFDTELERPVALKIMLPALAADAQYVERFRREARTVARLNHPNIVQVYSVGLTPETKRPYIAMQFIEGGSLDDVLAQLVSRDKLLPTDQALLIIRQIAEALAAAHNAGVIHRDLKPSNVLIRPDGAPMLVDLGIAAVSDKTRLTHTGGLIGTPHYMSPEQVRGQNLDGRSDLYALGVMLYEMLAGRLPFAEEDPITVLHKQAYEMPIPLEKRRPDLPPQVLALVATCLQKEPERRFQRAEAVVQAVNVALQVASSDATIAQTTEILTHLRDSALLSRQQVLRVPTGERPRRPVPLWAIVTFVILAAAVGALFFLRPENREQPLAAVTISPKPTDTIVPTNPTATLEQIIIVATNTNVPTSTATTAPTATAVATATPTASAAEFIIAATQFQNQTGLQIAPGQTILIEYVSGSWRAGPLPTWPFVGPDGDPQVASKATFPVPDAPVVSLIAGIGNAPPRFVGQRLQFQTEIGGLLWLGANDDDFSDNQGTLTVRITVEPATGPITQYQLISPVSPTPTPNQSAGVIDLGNMISMLEINTLPNNELSVSLVNNPSVIQGQPALEIVYKVRDDHPNDYAGIESHGLNVIDWQNYTNFCFGIINVDNYSGHLTVQFREQSDETWKTDIQIGNITNREVCVPLSTSNFIVQSSEKNKQIDLAAINKIAFYLGNGGQAEGTIYLYSIRLMP